MAKKIALLNNPLQEQRHIICEAFFEVDISFVEDFQILTVPTSKDWPDEPCEIILGHIRDAMGVHSLILIDELVLPDRGANKVETQLDMTMLSMLNGEARSESHWRNLLKAADLVIEDILLYQETGREAVIVAKKSVN